MFLAISYNLVKQNFQFFSFWILIIFLYTYIYRAILLKEIYSFKELP